MAKPKKASKIGSWIRHPLIYEINTWVWLEELSQTQNRPITLKSVPDETWDSLADLGVDAVWFMGVWERSPVGIAVSMKNEGLLTDFKHALPDFAESDNAGSPYCVKRYRVDKRLGGRAGLAAARKQLARRGIRLILDYVPNHVAPDHPWVKQHPEYFIQGNEDDLSQNPAAFLKIKKHIIACGRDPFFPAWPDVLQLNAFHPELRKAAIETVMDIASQCDAMRCDMAMLMMNPIFERTWGERAGTRPEREYWPELIGEVKQKHPEVLFIAEAYWDLEWELQQQGFDYCYDKRLYDRLEHGPAESVRLHLLAGLDYQEKLIRFIENHDEPRAAAAFALEKHKAAAVAVMTLPGARLLHEGQFEGRKVRLPVFLGRRPSEPVNSQMQGFYEKLLPAIRSEAIREGDWQSCEHYGWPDNQSCQNLLTWCWRKDQKRCFIAVNYSPHRSQAMVRFPWPDLAQHRWEFQDMLSGEVFQRDGNAMIQPGIYVELGGWAFHFDKLMPM